MRAIPLASGSAGFGKLGARPLSLESRFQRQRRLLYAEPAERGQWQRGNRRNDREHEGMQTGKPADNQQLLDRESVNVEAVGQIGRQPQVFVVDERTG